MITLVLADDHDVVRRGLRAILEAESDLEVVGEAADGLRAVRLVDELRPQLLVLDLTMPSMNGLEVTRQVRERRGPTRIIMLSMHATEAYVREAFRAGALGYVVKSAGAEELVDAVRAVAAGRHYLSAGLSERAVEAYVRGAAAAPAEPHETLSDREREVLQLAAEGHTSGQIGAMLFLSPRTVETHRASLMRKLGLRTQSELIRYAFRHGILQP